MTTVNPPPGSPSPLDQLLAEARVHYRAGRFAEAAAAYQQLLAVRPGVAELHNELGSALAFQNKFDEAQCISSASLRFAPTSPRPIRTWAICCGCKESWSHAAAISAGRGLGSRQPRRSQ